MQLTRCKREDYIFYLKLEPPLEKLNSQPVQEVVGWVQSSTRLLGTLATWLLHFWHSAVASHPPRTPPTINPAAQSSLQMLSCGEVDSVTDQEDETSCGLWTMLSGQPTRYAGLQPTYP